MRILWITNILFAHHRTMMGLDSSKVTGGTWLNAAYEASLNDSDIELHIATIGNVSSIRSMQNNKNTFYILPGGSSIDYNISDRNNYLRWESLQAIVNPDAVIIWGTETRFAYVAMKALKNVPIAIYMQGVINSIYEHYYDGLPHKYKLQTPRDLINRFNPKSQYNNFKDQARLESEMFLMAKAVIVENDWCEDMCKNINPDLQVFRNLLPIRSMFYSKQWRYEEIEPYSIFTNAGGYPIKGHHILFKALGIVKQQFPKFKCYVPGEKLSTFNNLKRRTGYTNYLNHLLRRYKLEDNVIFTGRLTTEEMCDRIVKSNIFVMPSIVENHSSSLIEAMIVGAPSISSLVGGTASFVDHKKNGILYNGLDYASLAGNIIRLFKDSEFANSLSNNSLLMRDKRKQDFGLEMKYIYSALISGK